MDIMIDGLVVRWLTYKEAYERVAKLIDDIGMTRIGRFAWRDTPIGASFYQMIMESHIAMDYMDKVIWLHLSSCKPYDYMKAAQYLIDAFEIHTLLKDVLLIRRGLDFDEDQEKTHHIEVLKGLKTYEGVTPAMS